MAQCRHVNQTMRVSSHINLRHAHKAGEPTASRYSCDRPACLEAAKAWVKRTIRRDEAHVVPLAKKS